MESKRVIMMPGYTIDAVIKRENCHVLTPEELGVLRNAYNQLNGVKAPRVGESVLIPILKKENF